jgi:integrase
LNQLQFRDRVLVLLLASTGMRRGKLLALQWSDVDFLSGTLAIRKSIWHQHLGPVKTEESEKTMPLDEDMVADLERWREQTAYAGDSDWIFASDRKRGRQPLWPEAIMRQRIIPAARRAGINQPLNWHAFRHTLSTLLVANGEDIKTVQSLLRHASPDVTLGIYTRAVNSRKRQAQNKVVEMIRPLKAVSIVALAGVTALCTFA